ncbi:hypothetical protein AOA14_15435 [Sphingopyxis terrae subsp. terrae NBRC 15098]|uniref:Uncharacterized protein n=1 Tax=Sphingopyxis terrae subsp. terrae NBRC 15098 TaxID=1219058 RepID=A0A142W1P9_9SPHN|nr:MULTISPECIES: hypothetical protein [Sphingopyxis]AMU96000.1 hypothetical protein AOA14_15435 [Sphingopyxis terrae subsp. terrae NBRC 15098]
MGALYSITFDPRSGRPIPPMWWKLVPFFTVQAWVVAALMAFAVGLAIRDGQTDWIVGPSVAGVAVLLFTYWHRACIARAKLHFADLIARYESALSQ